MANNQVNVTVIGSGIVGLASAWKLQQISPGISVTLLEKEAGPGRHQSGRNSGVIHSGIYYAPGSLKARNSVLGRRQLINFCREHGIAYDLCGKIIVALNQKEQSRLDAIYKRGLDNGVNCRIIDKAELHEREPHCAGERAILVEDAGIVDYPGVCSTLAMLIESNGGQILYGTRVTGLNKHDRSMTVETDNAEYQADLVINCAGLYSDKVTAMDLDPQCQIVPFRGEYYVIKESHRYLCRHLIYPVPDPEFPFLGVHFTRRVNGDVECGPNAVLAFAREGYRKRDVNLPELAATLANRAFLSLAKRHWRMGMGEYVRSFSKHAFVKALQHLIPEIRAEHLEKAPAGVRAQALAANGRLLDDFLIRESEHAVHVCNAPSPAATACLTVGEEVARLAANKLTRQGKVAT